MKSAEIRERFLAYFEKKEHKILPGSSLVPSDPTVLLTLAGMLQFKPIFLGQEKPRYPCAATVQKCIRTIDMERVGKTARHHTFFEMLGNFSFGEYFKEKAINYAWELLTEEFGIPQAKLSVAVFEKDDEAYSIWRDERGLPEDKIFRLDEENNFWAAGPTGPCGPCSEIYYDQGPDPNCKNPNCQPGCDCDRFLEVWNLVFIQYDRNEKGELVPLKQKGIDTGMGLERIASVLQGKKSNFETDLFVPLIQAIEELSKVEVPVLEGFSESQRQIPDTPKRIIADHIRAVTHLIADQVVPSNEGRGYVLRRLIRRMVLYGKLYALKLPFASSLASVVIREMGGFYPDLKKKEKLIIGVIKQEEEHFIKTLDQGLEIFRVLVQQYEGKREIPGKEAFKLHDTYGFQVELTRELAEKNGLRVDIEGFEAEMEKQKERGRKAGMGGEKKELALLNLEGLKPTSFIGYEKTSVDTKIMAVFPDQKFVVLEKTAFYPEQGGQVGDTGILRYGKKEVKVLDTLISPSGVIGHKVSDADGLKKGDKVTATINVSDRHAIQLHHTVTHLLHKALREVLGDQVKQAGSYVGPDKLRFDFNHFEALTPEEINRVGKIVNQKIREKLKVEVLQKSYEEAVEMGAMALFGEKYGERVRVLKIGNYSLELCGGTHAKSCAEILFFKIQAESAVGAGIRRIEALAGEKAKIAIIYHAKSSYDEVRELIREYKMQQRIKESLGGKIVSETNIFEIDVTELDRLAQAVDEQDAEKVARFLEHLSGRVQWLKERVAKEKEEINDLRIENVSKEALALAGEVKNIKEINVLAKDFSEYNIEMLRTISDVVQKQVKSCLIVLASIVNGKVRFLITVTADLVKKGYSAKRLAEVFGGAVGGKGGGREAKAEGGGNNPSKIKEAFDKVLETL